MAFGTGEPAGSHPSVPAKELDAALSRLSAQGENGQLSPLASVGGVRGLLEALLPGIVFTGIFTATRQLTPAMGAALAIALVFTAVRLIQRQPIMQAVSGLVAIGISALVVQKTGDPSQFFLPGLLQNAFFALATLLSMVLGWPFAGLLFGFLRGEGLEWRASPARRRAYTWASLPILALFLVRLAVKVPLYLSGRVAELGVMNALLGVPAYLLVLWIGWMMSRPAIPAEPALQDPSPVTQKDPHA